MTVAAVKPLRMSSVADCVRKAVLDASTPPDREFSREEAGWMWRGRRVGQDWVLFVAHEHDWKVWVASGPRDWVPADMAATSAETADIIAEVPVRWELGVGHADAWIREVDSLVEVVSSASASAHHDRKARQLTGYLMHHPAERGVLVTVDPSNMVETDRIILARDSKTFLQAQAEMEERIAAARIGATSATLPGRVCRKPSDARGHFCVRAVTCFTDWEPVEVQPVDNPEVRDLAVRLFEVKQQIHDANAAAKLLDPVKKQLQARLDEYLEPGEYMVGPLKVRRREKHRASFSLKAAEASLPAGLLDDFVSVSRWTEYDVTRETDQPLRDADSFGPHPFDEAA